MTIDERTRIEAALPPRGPVYSDVFEFGKGRRYKFRLLDSLETMWAIVAAERATLRMLREQFDDEPLVRELLKTHAPNNDLQAWWTELYCLQAALCLEDGAPVVEGEADARAEAMADLFTMVERADLAGRFASFAEDNDPADFSSEDIAGIVEGGKKTPGPSYWRRYGSNTLRRCVTTLVTDLESTMARIAELEAQVAALPAEGG